MKNQSLEQVFKKIDNKQGRQILVIVAVLVAAFFGWTSLKPSYEAANLAKQEAASTRTAAQDLQKEYNTLLPQLQNNKASDISNALNTAMPTQVDNVNVDKVLNNLATQTGVQINTFSPGQVTEGSSYQTLPISLTLSGSYINCLRFLGGLQSMVQIKGDKAPKAYGPIWAVTAVSLSSVDAASSTMNLSTNMYLTPSKSSGSDKNKSSSSSGGAAQ